MPKNLEQLIAEVKARKADIGIALDGDADRIGVVDDTGQIMFGDQLMVLLARDVLRNHPGATIIADVKASQVLFDEIAKAGGKPLMWRTGHSLIKSKMAETGSPLAGEMSGHIFFADHWYGFDDALYAAVRTLGIVARMDGALSEVRERAAAGGEHAGAALRLRRPPQVRGDPGGGGTPAHRGRQGVRCGWRAGESPRTAGGCCAPPTPRRCWWRAPRRTTAAGLERLKSALVRQLEASGLAAPDFSGSHAGH